MKVTLVSQKTKKRLDNTRPDISEGSGECIFPFTHKGVNTKKCVKSEKEIGVHNYLSFGKVKLMLIDYPRN